MTFNLLSCNMRGVRDKSNLAIVRRKIKKLRPWVVAIQETNSSTISEGLIRHIWVNKPCMWDYIEFIGASGGSLNIWDEDQIEKNKRV